MLAVASRVLLLSKHQNTFRWAHASLCGCAEWRLVFRLNLRRLKNESALGLSTGSSMSKIDTITGSQKKNIFRKALKGLIGPLRAI